MGIGQVLTMPLFFASNAIYPVSLMPGWLQVIAHANPLTYEVDALRTLMLVGGVSVYGLALDFAVLGGATVVLTLVALVATLRSSVNGFFEFMRTLRTCVAVDTSLRRERRNSCILRSRLRLVSTATANRKPL